MRLKSNNYMANNGQDIERRTVLRSIVAGGAVVAGAGLASGAPDSPSGLRPSKVEQQYGDVETVEGLFEAYGEPVRDALVDRGYLQEGGPVSVDSVVSRHDFALGDASDVAAIGTGWRDGTDVVDVRVRQQTGGYKIEYHLNPGIEDGYALVEPVDGGEGAIVFPDGTEEVSTTSTCCPSTGCPDQNCGSTQCTTDWCDCQNGYNYYYEEILCCQKLDDGSCLCAWETNGCDCPDYVGVCPE